MKNWFMKLVSTVGNLFHSKKFLATVSAVGASIAAGEDPKKALLYGGLTYVGAQGVADFGKNAPPKN